MLFSNPPIIAASAQVRKVPMTVMTGLRLWTAELCRSLWISPITVAVTDVIVRFSFFSLLHFLVTPAYFFLFFLFLGCEGPDAEVNLRLSSRLQNLSVPELWSTILSDMDPAAAVLKIPRYSGLLLPK